MNTQWLVVAEHVHFVSARGGFACIVEAEFAFLVYGRFMFCGFGLVSSVVVLGFVHWWLLVCLNYFKSINSFKQERK